MVQPRGPLRGTSISKILTPFILVAGLIFFAVHDFSGVLVNTQQQDDQFHNLLAFRQGPLGALFKDAAGVDRPSITYYNDSLLSYVEWSSTITINGKQQELWNNSHDYRSDEKNHAIYNTINGNNWHLIQRIALVNNRTVTVTFRLNIPPQASVGAEHIVLDIVHSHNFWLTQQLQGNTFVAQVMLGDPETLQRQQQKDRPVLLGTLALTVQSTLSQRPTLLIPDAHSILGTQQSWQWNHLLMTEYVVDNPQPAHEIDLGTETITFQPNTHLSSTI